MTDQYDTAGSWIAIVGIAGRFPGAPDLDAYWELLLNGHDAGVTLDAETLAGQDVPDKVFQAPHYVRRALLLDGVDQFDETLFGFTPAAACQMDPQQRLFLQTVHHALEDAALDPWAVTGRTGVFAATSTSTYLLNALMSGDPFDSMAYGANMRTVSLAMGNDKDYIATRVAHSLNLTGPAVSVQTACSSALVALHLACQSLLVGDCELAVAGGVSVRVPSRVGYFAEPGSIMSPSGQCRPFDAAADGTVFGSGVGAVVLKPYLAAVEDGDPVRAVIRGSAINNDGNLKMGYSAPSVVQQAQVIADALAVAGVNPSQVGFIEGHGTGTPIGDPVEVQALARRFAGADGTCQLGSVKGNVGHLEAASGMASLIKAVLALEHRVIPGTCHYESPNPEMCLEGTPLQISSEPTPWEEPVRIAGVTSLGVGGTNVHVVLQSVEQQPVAPQAATGRAATLRLSAATPEALGRARLALAEELDATRPPLQAVEATLTRRHRTQPHRCTITARTSEKAAAALRGAVPQRQALATSDHPELVFGYTGQGSQFPRMGVALAQAEPDFAAALAETLECLGAVSGNDFAALLRQGVKERIDATENAQPLLFAIQHAWTQTLAARGLAPAVVLGHSIGEFAAATAAGVMDLETAARLVCARGQLMADCPTGSMVSFRGDPATTTEAARELGLDVAVINSPQDVVLSGDQERVAWAIELLATREVSARPVATSHAFHSDAMARAAEAFTELVAAEHLHAPQIPMASNTTGGWLTASEATSPRRWGQHIRQTVRFADDLDLVLSRGPAVMVELGPGRALVSAAQTSASWDASRHRSVLTLGPANCLQDGSELARCLGDLWSCGIALDDVTPAGVGTLHLPGYSFEPNHHWVSTPSCLPRTRHDKQAADEPQVPGQVESSIGLTEQLVALVEETLGLSGVRPDDDFYSLGGDSVVAIRLASDMTQRGWPLDPQDVMEASSLGALAERLSKGLIDPGRDEQGNQLVDLVPTQLRLLHEGGLTWQQWRIPLLLRSRAALELTAVEHAFSVLVARHDVLRLVLDDQSHPLSAHVLAERPVPVADHGRGTVTEAEELLCKSVERPGKPDALVEAHLWSEQGAGSLLGVVVPHVFVDDASQRLVLEELAQLLTGDDRLPAIGTSWVEWTRVAAKLSRNPSLAQSSVPAPETDAATSHQPRHQRLTTTIETGLVERLLEAQQLAHLPWETILGEAFGEALARQDSSNLACFEMEGSMRSLRIRGVDLSRTVGWFTTVHPVIWQQDRGLQTPPNQGFGHDAARLGVWQQGRTWNPVRTLFYYRAMGSSHDGAPLELVRSSRLETSVAPGLGHDLQVEVTREDSKLTVVWWHDAERIDADQVKALAADFAAALRARATTSEVSDEFRDALAAELGL